MYIADSLVRGNFPQVFPKNIGMHPSLRNFMAVLLLLFTSPKISRMLAPEAMFQDQSDQNNSPNPISASAPPLTLLHRST